MGKLHLSRPQDALTLIARHDLSAEVRSQALAVVAGFPAIADIPTVIQVLREAPTSNLSLQAGKTLAAIGSRRATRPLLGLIRSSIADHVTFSCVYALWSLRDRRAEATLRWVVANETLAARTRGLAAEILGLFQRSQPLLVSYATHPIADIRCGALFGVAASRKGADCLSGFFHLLHDDSTTSSGERVRDLAARIIDESGVDSIVLPAAERV
jgi:hypothetical protein